MPQVAGSGVTGDLLAHSIDTAEWLNGPIASVTANTETFVKERQHAETGKVEPVDIDDACMFLARFKNGSMGTFESTRYARGRKEFNTFELNGEKASLNFDLEDLHYLEYFDHGDEGKLTGWRKIHVTNPEHPYMKNWWVPGLHDRLRAHVHPPAGRFPRRPARRASRPSRLSRRPSKRRRSATPCWQAPGGPLDADCVAIRSWPPV